MLAPTRACLTACLCRDALLCIILRLCVPEGAVFAAAVGKQRGMAALLDDRTLVKHSDLIAELAGGQPVRDENRRPVPCDLIKLAVDLRLGDRIQRRRRLVKDCLQISLWVKRWK